MLATAPVSIYFGVTQDAWFAWRFGPVTLLFGLVALFAGAGVLIAMNPAQRKLTICFSAGIALALVWGLGTYAHDWYKDLTSPPISEAVYLHGTRILRCAVLISSVLAISFTVCYVSHRTNPAAR